MCEPEYVELLTAEEEAALLAADNETDDPDTWTWDTRVTLADPPSWFGPVTDEQIAEAMAEAPPDEPPTDDVLDAMARYFGRA